MVVEVGWGHLLPARGRIRSVLQRESGAQGRRWGRQGVYQRAGAGPDSVKLRPFLLLNPLSWFLLFPTKHFHSACSPWHGVRSSTSVQRHKKSTCLHYWNGGWVKDSETHGKNLTMVNLWEKKLCSVDFNKGAILCKSLVNILAQPNFILISQKP